MTFTLLKWRQLTVSNRIFEILEEVIAEDYKIKPNNENSLVIQEEKKEAKGKQVSIKTSNKVFSFSLDQEEQVFRFFNNSTEGINKANDAILICCKGEQIYALLIELKSDKPKNYMKQILSGKNFVEFLKSTIALHYKKNIQINYRGFLFDTRYITVKKTTTKKNKIEIEIKEGIEFSHLKCNDTYYLAQLLE